MIGNKKYYFSVGILKQFAHNFIILVVYIIKLQQQMAANVYMKDDFCTEEKTVRK